MALMTAFVGEYGNIGCEVFNKGNEHIRRIILKWNGDKPSKMENFDFQQLLMSFELFLL